MLKSQRTLMSQRRDSGREDRPSEKYRNHSYGSRLESENLKRHGEEDRKRKTEDLGNVKPPSREENGFQNRRRKGGSKLSEEERAARFKQMQMDAEVHEEQRWRRLKKADETDAVEASKNKISTGKSFWTTLIKVCMELRKVEARLLKKVCVAEAIIHSVELKLKAMLFAAE
ncbi:hypothetical protein Bca52824_008878 [Brassica carinata]|uniref:Uncharacterized protein n=1 Tax=Brassica carinata TaxID=52824 RepID=A0A8X7WBK2_BRACI|nr:hypothetical protein Bca52824_008878 [Brassica carinata]